MRAARIHAYGGADQLRLEDVELPTCGPDDLPVEVKAAAINPIDFKLRGGGQRAVVRLALPWTLGMDVAGVVLEVGARVRDFSVGDEIYASPGHRRMGGYAEQIVIRAAECARKPTSLSFEEAASVPLAALTAWDALVDACKVGEGDRVLIQAGAGGVGTFAIQLAKARGAEVLTTCSARNVEHVRSLGADVAIDYHTSDYAEIAKDCDGVLESIGGEHIVGAIRTVRRGGTVAVISPGLPTFSKRHGPVLGVFVLAGQILRWTIGARLSRGVKVKLVTRKARGHVLRELATLIDQGTIRPVVDRVFPLDQVSDAHRYLEQGHARGKVVLAI